MLRYAMMPAIKNDVPAPTALEFELMFLCARMMVDATAETRIQALVQQVDWNSLILAAHQHRVLPLLCRSLDRVARESVPESVMQQLRSAFHGNARRNLFLTRELLQVMDLFRVHDIPCIPYKGPVLSSMVYGDVSLRQFGDLDVIVLVKDVLRAKALLVSRGYRPQKQMSDEELLAFTRTEKEIALLRDDIGINIELHWGVTADRHPIRIPADLLWKDLRACSVAGQSVPTPGYEDLLVILCVHGTRHRWERLGWLCDVAEIVRRQPDLDWNRAIENAVELGARRVLFLGVVLARELLGAEPPAQVVRLMREDSMLGPLSDQVKGWLSRTTPVPLDPGEQEQYFMRLTEHSCDKLRLAYKEAKKFLALTTRDTESMPVPGYLTCMLYPLRPIRLAREYGLRPFKRFFSGIFQS